MFLLSRLAWLPINIDLTNLFTALSTDDKDRQIVVQCILGVLAIAAVVGLLGTVLFSDSAGAIHGYEEVLGFVEGDGRG